MSDQYDPDEVTIIFAGERVEGLQNFDPPEESYDREYDTTVGDDDNILLQDTDPNLEGEIEIAPTSRTITRANELLRSGEQFTITIRFPSDDVRENETYIDVVLLDKGYANSFDGESLPNRTYSFIADDIK